MNVKDPDPHSQGDKGVRVTLTPQQSQFAEVLGFELANCWNEENAASDRINSRSATIKTSKNQNN